MNPKTHNPQMQIQLSPIAFVENTRQTPTDDNWSPVHSIIRLAEDIPTESLENIGLFSHLLIVYYFDKVVAEQVVFSGHPRGNLDYPKMGIFAQRKKDRPNQIGVCTVELLAHEGRTLRVKYLDAIHGTPVLDIKPIMREFEPQGAITQPAWVDDLMRNYW
jgi:tRNA-Thr(GGU) m(6)t(6)A37 methyltransferase TsaA